MKLRQIKVKILFTGRRNFTTNGLISNKYLENGRNSYSMTELKYRLTTVYIKYVLIISGFQCLLHRFLWKEVPLQRQSSWAGGAAKISPSLQANRLACHRLVDVARRHRTPGPAPRQQEVQASWFCQFVCIPVPGRWSVQAKLHATHAGFLPHSWAPWA